MNLKSAKTLKRQLAAKKSHEQELANKASARPLPVSRAYVRKCVARGLAAIEKAIRAEKDTAWVSVTRMGNAANPGAIDTPQNQDLERRTAEAVRRKLKSLGYTADKVRVSRHYIEYLRERDDTSVGGWYLYSGFQVRGW